ncbi:ABC transporter permease [Lentibacillus halophilus]|uniref:ABC transporter permease n=1 Tax=Lentibacillus halophilus TaxID=295065 RepID=A0ABN0Z3X4_9BACI
MSNFLQLLVNEQVKLYIRKSTWIMYILLGVIVIGLALLASFEAEQTEKYQSDNWRQTLKDENAEIKEQMKEDDIMHDFSTNQIEKNNFYLDNGIQPRSYDAWQFVLEHKFLLSLVSLFTIIVASGIIANEFKWGTIKLLLIRPITRTTILASKYVSVLLFALFTLLFLLIFSWLVGALLFGVNGMDPQMVLNQTGEFTQVSIINQMAEGYGLQLITLVMMATLAFMISAIFRQSSLAIGIAIFLMLSGSPIVSFLSEYSWAKYILFANTNMDQYINGSPLFEGMSLGFSIIVLAVYYVIFIAVTWTFFTKRDVAGH